MLNTVILIIIEESGLMNEYIYSVLIAKDLGQLELQLNPFPHPKSWGLQDESK